VLLAMHFFKPSQVGSALMRYCGRRLLLPPVRPFPAKTSAGRWKEDLGMSPNIFSAEQMFFPTKEIFFPTKQ